LKSYFITGDFITIKCSHNDIYCSSLVYVMTSSINLDADWSVVSQLPDAINTFVVQCVNRCQLSFFSKLIMHGCSITHD